MISSMSSSTLISSTILLTDSDPMMIETDADMSTENVTIYESTMNDENTTTLPELKPLKTVMIVINNHGHILSWNFTFRFTLFQLLFVLVIYLM